MSQRLVTFYLLRPYVWPLALLIAANSLIVFNAPAELRYLAALMLLAFLPGWVWVRAFLSPLPSDPSPPRLTAAAFFLNLAEQLTLAIGLSLALTIMGAMFAVYLPGALSLPQLLVTMDVVILTGLSAAWWKYCSPAPLLSYSPAPPLPCPPAPPLPRPSAPLLSVSLLVLALLLLLAAVLRLPRLGYAEFHEDEAEALMLGVRLMQGEDYALFLHRKGPAQMLIPLAFWLLTGQIGESLARFPFALSSILSIATLFFLGRRWFNWQAGAMAGLLWAVNGYAVAFGRMVQYQALIFFLGPLALYCLYRGVVEGWRIGKWQVWGAVLLAVCLLAHFDALMLLPAAAYLGWLGSISRGTGGQGGRGEDNCAPTSPRASTPGLGSRIIAAVLVLTFFFGLLASFYVPYLLDPEFKNTANYLAESRVKPGFLYNNLNLLRQLDQDYSSRFYLPLLAAGIIGFAVWPGLTRRNWRTSFASAEAVTAWLMFGAGFISYLFLVDDPRTHLYIIYPGAVLLAGAGWTGGVEGWKGRRVRKPFFHSANLPMFFSFMLGLLVLIPMLYVVLYEALIFLQTESALDRLHQHWAGSTTEWVYHKLPKAREYFGYPKREGWKAIGALRAQGLFPGDFRSISEDFIIPIWYNYGQARSCYDTPAQFFVRAYGSDVYIPEEKIREYDEAGWVQREGEVRLRIFSAKNLPGSSLTSGQVSTTPTIYALEELANEFDQHASPQHFIQQTQPSHPIVTQFGPAIRFLGFDLPQATVAPGETLYVNLYWQALQPPDDAYRAFIHLTDGVNLWGQQDDDPACRLPTSVWRTGQRGLGQFRLPIKPETPPGRYPLIIGLYQANTLERLKITAGAGKVGDDFLWLGDVEVK